jgi:hypothetical protein
MIRASLQRVSSSPQTYQFPYGPSGSDREAWNHGWSLEVWFMTRSAITRIPRWWAWSTTYRKSSIVP